jgi:hypothetical protein
MAKIKPLTNTQKAKAQELIVAGKNTEQIAKALDVKEDSVNRYIEQLTESLLTIKSNQDAVEEKTTASPTPAAPMVKRGPKAINMMSTKTAGKGIKGVSVMSAGASGKLDETRKTVQKPNFDYCIYRPLDKKESDE